VSRNPAGVQACDLLIRNAFLLTLDAKRTVHRSGALAISGERIVAVGPETELLPAFRPLRILDAGGATVHPGFIEAHFHMGQHSARGIDSVLAACGPPAPNFADWKAALAPEDEHASTALACLDLLRNGFTGFVDGGTSFDPDAVAAAAEAIGMRGWLADPYIWDRRELMEHVPTLISRSLETRVPFDTDHAIRQLGRQLRRNAAAGGLVRGYVAVYGLGTASDELHRAAKACADAAGVTCAIHFGYNPAMSQAEEALWGRPAMIRLAELGALDRATLLIHANVLRDDEIAPLTKSGASVIWCPTGYLLQAAPAGIRSRMPELHRAGVNVALGIDGAGHCAIGDTPCLAGHVAIMAGETMSPWSLLEMLTINGARAMGCADQLGSLEPGKQADVVIRRADVPDAQPLADPVFQLAMLSRATSVDTVIVAGRIVLRRGRSTLVDERVTFADVRASVARMLRRLGLRGGDVAA
jgi:cytosine/adenosine deaminase-related metal-dependent hydrolase